MRVSVQITKTRGLASPKVNLHQATLVIALAAVQAIYTIYQISLYYDNVLLSNAASCDDGKWRHSISFLQTD